MERLAWQLGIPREHQLGKNGRVIRRGNLRRELVPTVRVTIREGMYKARREGFEGKWDLMRQLHRVVLLPHSIASRGRAVEWAAFSAANLAP
jgi:hypothetical protein